jgi:hypothetical protein
VRGVIRVRDPVRVHRPAVLEREVEVRHVRADRPGRLDVGRVVRARHDQVVAGLQERGVDDEQGRDRSGRHDHVIRDRTRGIGRDGLAQLGQPEVVAVLEHQPAEVHAQVGQRRVAHRAFRQVPPDAAVAQLLG